MSISAVNKTFIDQLEAVIKEYKDNEDNFYDSDYRINTKLVSKIVSKMRAIIHRTLPPNSVYIQQCEEILSNKDSLGYKAERLFGTIESIYSDFSSGYMQNISELIHGELFGDFLDMSQHLIKEGYKDAAAVIAGSALEAHLRQLCIKAGIETEIEREDKIQPKKADRMNADLAKAEIYSKSDQKIVTAWLDFRNDAAHGHYDKYRKEQIAIMITGIRDFFTRNPA